MPLRLLILSALLCSACLTVGGAKKSHREQADYYAQQGKYAEAISAYRLHIQERLATDPRPEWENPYLYYLDIGDIYLRQNRVKEALQYYQLAQEQAVAAEYINDRIRYVAVWYEQQGELHQALEHLQEHRDRDPILFDLMLDRIAKQIVRAEERREREALPTDLNEKGEH